jgi:UDP-glucose 4-epimerase
MPTSVLVTGGAGYVGSHAYKRTARVEAGWTDVHAAMQVDRRIADDVIPGSKEVSK